MRQFWKSDDDTTKDIRYSQAFLDTPMTGRENARVMGVLHGWLVQVRRNGQIAGIPKSRPVVYDFPRQSSDLPAAVVVARVKRRSRVAQIATSCFRREFLSVIGYFREGEV